MGNINIETVGVTGFKGAILGMRAPMQSYAKSDSKFYVNFNGPCKEGEIGPADLDLAKRLISGGTEHRKFLRMIHIQAKVTLPRYVWSEYDTYKIGTVADSESTMHKLLNTNTPITEDQFYFTEDTDERIKNIIRSNIKELELMRQAYKQDWNNFHYFENYSKNDLLIMAKQILPECFLQTRYIDINYETARTIYRQRNNHRLKKEWGYVREWLETLPYAKEFIMEE